MIECLSDTISEVTDRFLMRIGVTDKKKHFARYLVLAQECWEDLFQNTLWIIKSVWMPTKAGTPYNYVDVPQDCLRLLSVSVTDKCNTIQDLYYNNRINVVPKPTSKKCGCTCDCGGLCEDVGGTVCTTRFMFTINNVDYYEKCWLKYCPDGSIIQYCETPAIKYNTPTGTGGDYNNDFNDDFLHSHQGFGDFTIETIITQNIICKLETKPCGCPVESPENEQCFLDCCGAFINWGCRSKRNRCKPDVGNVNNNYYGEVKLSQCGTRIEYRHSPHWKRVADKQTPDWLLVNYQTSGESVGSETLIPKYARNAMYAYLDCGRKEFNSAFTKTEKDDAYYKKISEKNNIVAYLNPIDLIELSKIQDIPIKL